MVGTDVSSRSPMHILGEHMPNSGRVRQELVNSIKRNAHGQKHQCQSNHLNVLLPVQVINDREEQKRVNKYAHQFLTGNILDVCCGIPYNGVQGESYDGPADGWP